MGSKKNPGQFDCYENAMSDEPMFILLARDPRAPHLVEEWATARLDEVARAIRPISDLPKVKEALECARNMREWRYQNDGAWRAREG